VHNVSQRPNLRHLGEPLGGAKSLLETVSFKKVTESMGRSSGSALVRFLILTTAIIFLWCVLLLSR